MIQTLFIKSTRVGKSMMKNVNSKSYDIAEQAVREAYRKVKTNRGAEGIDQVTIEAFEQNLEGNLYKVWNRMS